MTLVNTLYTCVQIVSYKLNYFCSQKPFQVIDNLFYPVSDGPTKDMSLSQNISGNEEDYFNI